MSIHCKPVYVATGAVQL